MLDGAPIAYWVGFHVVVLVLIVADLAVLGRGKESTQTRRNFLFVLFLLLLAACFGVWIGSCRGPSNGARICLRLPDRALPQHR